MTAARSPASRDPERRTGQGSTEAAAINDLLTMEYEAEEDGEWTDEEREKFLRHRNPTHDPHDGECDASCYGYFDN